MYIFEDLQDGLVWITHNITCEKIHEVILCMLYCVMRNVVCVAVIESYGEDRWTVLSLMEIINL